MQYPSQFFVWCRTLPILALVISSIPSILATATVWDGGGVGLGGINAKWSVGANWQPDGVPVSGDEVIFEAGTTRTILYDLRGVTPSQIRFKRSGWTLAGTTTLPLGNGGLAAEVFAGRTEISADVLIAQSCEINVQGATAELGISGKLDINERILTVNGGGTIEFTGPLSGRSISTIVKGGACTLRLVTTSPSTYAGSILLNSGRLDIKSNLNQAGIIVSNGTLSGSASVSRLQATGGAIEPGLDDQAILSSGLGGIELSPSVQLKLDINSKGSDALRSSGPISLNGATLTLLHNSGLKLDAPWTLIQNDSKTSITGQFAGLSEGANITLPTLPSGVELRISYEGGDGNDVTAEVHFSGESTASIWRGATLAGGSAKMSIASHWLDNLVPSIGTPLHFGPDRLATIIDQDQGDIPLYDSLVFSAPGYTFQGLPLALRRGIQTLAHPTNVASFNIPVHVMAPQVWTLNGSLAFNSSSGLELHGGTLTTDRVAATNTVISGPISGPHGLIMRGDGQITLNTANTFGGPVILEDGILRLRHNAALGSIEQGTSVDSSGILLLPANASLQLAEPLELAGTLQSDAQHQWTGPLTIKGSPLLNAGRHSLTLTGDIGGYGTIRISAAQMPQAQRGTVTFGGAGATTFTGSLTVVAGKLSIERQGGLPGLSNLIIGENGEQDDATRPEVHLHQALLSANPPTLTVNHHATLNLDQVVGTFAATTLAGGTITAAGGRLALSGPLTTAPNSLNSEIPRVELRGDAPHMWSIQSPLTVTAVTEGGLLSAVGNSHLVFAAACSIATMAIDGPSVEFRAGGPTITLTSGTLGGRGAVGSVNATGGRISPGGLLSEKIAIFRLASLEATPAVSLAFDLQNLTPGVGHDQLDIYGTAHLNEASLNLTTLTAGAFTPGTVLTLIRRGPGSTGIFAHLPEGTVFAGGSGTAFRISYLGGDGNDVTLTSEILPDIVLESSSFTQANSTTPSSIDLVLRALPQTALIVESSNDLESWQSIAHNITEEIAGRFSVRVLPVESQARLFLRVRQ